MGTQLQYQRYSPWGGMNGGIVENESERKSHVNHVKMA